MWGCSGLSNPTPCVWWTRLCLRDDGSLLCAGNVRRQVAHQLSLHRVGCHGSFPASLASSAGEKPDHCGDDAEYCGEHPVRTEREQRAHCATYKQ